MHTYVHTHSPFLPLLSCKGLKRGVQCAFQFKLKDAAEGWDALCPHFLFDFVWANYWNWWY